MQKRPSPGWPFISQQAPDAPHAISLSGLVYGFLDRIFHFAYSLLAFAFELLSLAFSTQLVIVGRFTDCLFDITYRFVRFAFDLIASAAHGISPDEISDVITSTESLTRPPPREFHLFSGHHFVVPRRLSFMFAA
jgi:hypothetical protein